MLDKIETLRPFIIATLSAVLAIFLGGLSAGYALFGRATRRVYERARRLIAGSIRAAAGEVAEVDVLADQVLGLVQSAALAFHLESDRKRLRARLRSIGRLIETHVAYASLGLGTHP